MEEKINQEIVELTDKEKARKRINVWHGSSNNWINMIKEQIGNSLDVFDNSIHHNINIIIHNSNKITYIDDGVGIPVEGKTKTGTKNYEAIFEHPFAGSKYDANLKTVGQNGIFLYSLAMTCEDIDIEIGRPDKKVYALSYHKGDRTKDLTVIGATEKTYSKIIFSLDKEVWNNPDFKFEEISQIAEGQASLGNVTITVKDEINNLENKFRFANGIKDYFTNAIKSKSILLEDSIQFTQTFEKEFLLNEETVKDEFDIDLILNFSNDSEDNFQKDFLNTADLIRHGTIQDGIINGLRNSINKWLKDNNKYSKSDKQITLDDVSVGLNYICSVKNKIVEYENQTKQKTTAEYYKTILKKYVEDNFEAYFATNPSQAKKICEQILVNSKARISADKARLNVQKKLSQITSKKKVKIEGLTDCKMRESKLEERILLIVEGKSAKSTVVEAYDNRIMGALGLRGRFISCLKKSVEEVLNNDPAYTLIQALGCGIEIPYEERKLFKDINSYNEDNLRYNAVGILTDADCFGSGIRLALLTFFYKYMPNLLKQGKIYIVVTPRYEITMNNGTTYYPHSDREKDELMKTIKEEDIKDIGIVKGIGELNKEYFWDEVLAPEVREKTFVQVSYDEAEEVVKQLFEDYMGKDVEPRKEFVKEFIDKFNLEDIN